MSIVQAIFDTKYALAVTRKNGHLYIDVPIIIEGQKFDTSRLNTLDLIFDSGAHLSVISENTLARYGLDKYIDKSLVMQLKGFGGTGSDVHVATLPGIYLGGKVITGIKVLVPVKPTTIEVLGRNVLEYMIFFFDTPNNIIYFKENTNPRPIKGLECSVFTTDGLQNI